MQGERHRWNKKGDWQGSKDVRICLRCGIEVWKMGLYGGYQVSASEGAQEVYHSKMPPCAGEKS